MATTPNYGWVTPAPTDLVTDLPADFEVFADAVDADLGGLLGGTTGQVLAKTTDADHDFDWITPAGSPITTEGDLIIGDATGDAVRLPIGAANTILTSDGDTADWVTPSFGVTNWTAVNSGGTTLNGVSTVTISGITGANKLWIFLTTVRSGTASQEVKLRINADTGSNYYAAGQKISSPATYEIGFAQASTVAMSNPATSIHIMQLGNVNTQQGNAGITITGGNSSGAKIFAVNSGANGTNQNMMQIQGYYDSSSTISSVTVQTLSANFNLGTIFVYKSA